MVWRVWPLLRVSAWIVRLWGLELEQEYEVLVLQMELAARCQPRFDVWLAIARNRIAEGLLLGVEAKVC